MREAKLTWTALTKWLKDRYAMDMKMDAILFLIGVQELGKGAMNFSKTQKMELMHVGICAIMEKEGYYKKRGVDSDGWPQYEAIKKIPNLSKSEQDQFMKERILEYFEPMAILE
jgi:hypothetical protein